ncbi:MAG: threonine/homoserine/homoserine lactone efflux protein [Paraglaciecola sp.]|jgi:threonine/homoserine/homoserine lactone efflux protein
MVECLTNGLNPKARLFFLLVLAVAVSGDMPTSIKLIPVTLEATELLAALTHPYRQPRVALRPSKLKGLSSFAA